MDDLTRPIARVPRNEPVETETPPEAPKKTRMVFVDIARAIGAMLVVYSHVTELWTRQRGSNTGASSPVINVLDALLRDPLHMQRQGIGQVAVPIFFLISGFVVTPIALKQGERKFAINRALRIYPALIFVVLLTALVLVLGMDPLSTGNLRTVTPLSVLTNALLVNYLVVPQIVLVGVAWTLIVEVLFYVVLTALLWLFRRNIAVAIGAELAFVLVVLLTYRMFGDSYFLLSIAVSYIPIILLGQTIWAGFKRQIPLWLVGIYLAAGWSLYVWADIRKMGRLDTAYNLALAFAVLFFLLGLFTEDRLKQYRVWTELSERTYSIYLMHGLVAFPVLSVLAGKVPFELATVLAIIATAGGVEVCYRFVEQPSHRLARRLSTRKEPAPEEPPAVEPARDEWQSDEWQSDEWQSDEWESDAEWESEEEWDGEDGWQSEEDWAEEPSPDWQAAAKTQLAEPVAGPPPGDRRPAGPPRPDRRPTTPADGLPPARPMPAAERTERAAPRTERTAQPTERAVPQAERAILPTERAILPTERVVPMADQPRSSTDSPPATPEDQSFPRRRAVPPRPGRPDSLADQRERPSLGRPRGELNGRPVPPVDRRPDRNARPDPHPTRAVHPVPPADEPTRSNGMPSAYEDFLSQSGRAGSADEQPPRNGRRSAAPEQGRPSTPADQQRNGQPITPDPPSGERPRLRPRPIGGLDPTDRAPGPRPVGGLRQRPPAPGPRVNGGQSEPGTTRVPEANGASRPAAEPRNGTARRDSPGTPIPPDRNGIEQPARNRNHQPSNRAEHTVWIEPGQS